MQASIIIPTHQRHSSLLALLSSLHLQDLPKSEWEAIIVSNQQDPRLRKGLKSFFKTTCRRRSSYHFLEVGKLGVNRARNLGIAHAKAKYLFFLDDDCFVRDPSYLRRGVELLDKWTEVSAIGGPYSLREKSNTCEQVYNSICRHWLESSVRKSGFTTNLVGGNMVIRQSVFAGDLRFNESIIFGGAETEFNCRLLRQGYRLKYDPTFTVEHRLDLNLRTFFLKAFWQGFGSAQREMCGLQTEKLPTSLLRACPYPDRSTEFHLKLYDRGFQMGSAWVKRYPERRPALTDLISLTSLALKSDPGRSQYRQWFRLGPQN